MVAAVDRLPPHNLEAEQSVLGSLLIDRDAIIRVASVVKPDDFYHGANGIIYQAILDLYNRREPTDFLTLSDELTRKERLDQVGGIAYLSSLLNAVPTAVHVEYYGKIVERTATLRRLIDAGAAIVGIGYREGIDTEEALDLAQRTIFDVSQHRSSRDFQSIADVLEKFFDQIDYLQQHRGSVVGVPTGFTDLDQLTGGLQKSDLIIVAARPSVGKCLTAASLIDDPLTGERRTIEDCVRRKISRVLGLSATGQIRSTAVSDWIDSGVQPCVRVVTRTGRAIEVTRHHPFLTVRGWRSIGELQPGDRIAVPRKIPVFGTVSAPAWLARFLAYFIAEGCLTDTTPEFTNTDPIIVDDFLGIIRDHFPTTRVRQERITYLVSRLRGRGGHDPNPVTVLLRRYGLWGKGARDKAFPQEIWTWDRTALSTFMRVLMSCDGSVYQADGFPRIEFTVASERLALDVQHAFLRFGIVAKLEAKTAQSWRVHITEPASVAAYYAEIGWIGEKAERVFKSYDPARRRSNNGHAPVDVWETIRKVSRGRGLSLAELNRRAGDRPDSLHTNRSVPSRRLGKYAEILDDDRLLLAASRDIYWDQIDAIEDIGSHQVYDLTVPDGANFVANDVCVHNTAFALGLAYGAAVQHGRTVGVFSLEMAAEQLVQRLLSTETGVDSHRLRLGQIDDHEWDRVSRAFGRLAEAQIYIDDSAGLNVMEVRTKARRLQAEHGLDMLVIDYLQLMHARRSENRVQEISEISRGLKGLARELNIPVIALSQLSRAVETRSDHHPMLSDLRESGCLDGDTPVYLPDEGTWVPIRALVGRADVRVLALNEDTWKLEPQRILSAFATGHKPVFKLRTRLGRVIRATANHKFLTVQGWKRLDELDVSCHIALPRQLPGSGTPSMSKDELALLGHLIGDGCTLSRQPIHYTTADEDLAILVSDLGSKVFGDKIRPRVAREREWYQVYLAANGPLGHGTRNAVAAWLDGMGIFNLRSWEKRIPVAVFAQPRDEIACFLRHLWSTDGSLWLPRSTKAAPRIYYATSSPELASGVQSLLLRIGILASVSRHGQGSKGRDQYHVDVNGLPDQQRFLEIVGGVGQRKLRAAESISERNASKITNTNRDILPRDVWQIYALPAKRAIGMTERRFQAALGNHYCGSGLYRQNVSRERAARIAQIVACEKLARLARSDVYWDQVVSIEPDGEADVFDLTIEGLHNFVAGDVIVHNSIEQDADIVIFLYRDEIYDPNTERKGIAEVIVAKHRNGPVGTVNLRFFEKTARFADLELYRESSS